MVAYNGECVEVTKVSTGSAAYFYVKLSVADSLQLRQSYDLLDPFVFNLVSRWFPSTCSLCMFHLYDAGNNTFGLLESFTTSRLCNIHRITRRIAKMLLLEMPVNISVGGVIIRVMHVMMSETVPSSSALLHTFYKTTYLVCVHFAARIRKECLINCPYLTIDSAELTNVSEQKFSVENIRKGCFEINGKVCNICVQKYLSLISQNCSSLQEVTVWLMLLMLHVFDNLRYCIIYK